MHRHSVSKAFMLDVCTGSVYVQTPLRVFTHHHANLKTQVLHVPVRPMESIGNIFTHFFLKKRNHSKQNYE